MARSRMIRPEFWSDEKLANVSRDARLLYIGMWGISDDYGVVKGHPVWLTGQIFPYDEIKREEIHGWLKELSQLGRIVPFEAKGELYYSIPKFKVHQKVHNPSSVRNPVAPEPLGIGSVVAPESLGIGSVVAPEPLGIGSVVAPEPLGIGSVVAPEPLGTLTEAEAEAETDSETDADSRGAQNTSAPPPICVADKIPYEEIISDLNAVLEKAPGRRFQATTKPFRAAIKARWGEGYRLDDFKRVHRIKAEEWTGTDMEQHLTPDTLYRASKFPKYAAQEEKAVKKLVTDGQEYY